MSERDELENDLDESPTLDSGDLKENLEKKIVELENKLALSLADKENMRKRFERDSRDYAKHVVSNFASSVLEIVDNLELAMKASESDKNIHMGINMVYKQVLSILKNKNIVQQEIKEGDQFDSSKHEIVNEIESEFEKNSIIRVESHGYMMNDKVLRYAKVSVSSGIK